MASIEKKQLSPDNQKLLETVLSADLLSKEVDLNRIVASGKINDFIHRENLYTDSIREELSKAVTNYKKKFKLAAYIVLPGSVLLVAFALLAVFFPPVTAFAFSVHCSR